MATTRQFDLRYRMRPYLAREPVILGALAVLAMVLFLVVGGVSHAFHAQQQALGQRWFDRGVTDLKARRFDAAVIEFRAALRYSRDDYTYQLNLAEALVGLRHTGEAQAYFINLWEREPEDGLVNLELARIAAQRGETQNALRYYHNAIYATWPGDQEVARRETRLELIEFLLKINAKAQAQAELVALSENLASESSQDELSQAGASQAGASRDAAAQQERIAELFLRVQDYEHALAAYRAVLRSERQNRVALAGAGMAAFELGFYPAARRYLQTAAAAAPGNTQIAATLKMADTVLAMDPFQRGISMAQRDRVVAQSFATAGDRLRVCNAARGGSDNGSDRTGSSANAAATNNSATSSAPGLQPSLAERWEKMNPQISETGLRRNPDLVEPAMELVFGIERQTSASCGTPEGADMALLLIAKLHEGN
jgi:tetratricopeptide (TPR) repeat protein